MASIKRLVHWAAGDREKESEALAEEAEEVVAEEAADHSEAAETEAIETEALREVRRSHGDLGIGTKDSDGPDVAQAGAVVEIVRDRDDRL